MPLDPQAQTFVEVGGNPGLDQLTPEQARAAYQVVGGLFPREDVARVEELRIPVDGGEIAARLYVPEGAASPAPALVFFHPGGFCIGSMDESDGMCRGLANAAGCAVVNVDYRLAPEHRFPTAVEDAYASVCWVAANAADLGVDPDRLAVGGESAGGNLAAACCLLARERGGPALRFQLLLYPCLDGRLSYPSIRENGEGYFLTGSAMQWFYEHYVGDADVDPEDPIASPIYAKDLAGLPPCMVITAEYDPLRDEGEAYAERLRQAGVAAGASRYEGQIHQFASMPMLFDAAGRALDEAAGALRAALA